ncbi:MAG TPA: alpha/beta hydrolase [Flavobacterium sp.]|jgi:hypothetical protein
MKKILVLLVTLLSVFAHSQKQEAYATKDIEINPLIKGTLYTPEKAAKKTNLVILIAGSGPTDRNGNTPMGENNSLKFLSQDLATKKMAVFSYDKRIFAQIANKTFDEKTLRFDDFIKDAKDVIAYFRTQKTYHKIIIAGHSEGAQIGMIAAAGNADGYISIAGPGRPIDVIISEQIEKQAPTLKEEVQNNFEILKKGETFELKNQMLASIFRESLQPYIISWMQYNPAEEIKKLHIPVLIINGTKDLQVQVLDAELLKKAKPEAKLEIIADMNHLLKEIKTDEKENRDSYSNATLPVMPVIIDKIAEFVNLL